MWEKIKGFFKGLWDNKNTTMAAVTPLATAAAVSYGMATGVVPITPETVGLAVTSASGGVGLLLAKDAKKVEKVTQIADNTGVTAAQEITNAVSIVDQFSNMQKDAEDGQKKVEMFMTAASAISEIINKEQQPK